MTVPLVSPDHTLPCTCAVGRVRCERCRWKSHCALRMISRIPRDSDWKRTDPVRWTDTATSMNDARAALNIALGVPFHLIDPTTGHRKAPTP